MQGLQDNDAGSQCFEFKHNVPLTHLHVSEIRYILQLRECSICIYRVKEQRVNINMMPKTLMETRAPMEWCPA